MPDKKNKSVSSKKNKKTTKKTKATKTPKAVSEITAAQNNILVVNMIPLSLSGETEQDSEPFLAVNPSNPLQIVGSAFTPDPFGGTFAPIFVSGDGGNTWTLKSTVPSNSQTGDITVAFSGKNNLYSGILKRPGNLLLNILRTNNASGSTPMSVLSNRQRIDQPFMQAKTIGNKDRVYVGSNDFAAPGGRTAAIDLSMDAAKSTPSFKTVYIEKRNTSGQNGPQIRPCVHSDGTVYAVFYGWRVFNGVTEEVNADVVVVRDDTGGNGTNAFSNLKDTDGIDGKRVAQGVKFIWDSQLGRQRLGGNIAISVDPANSSIVYVTWAELNSQNEYTLHLRRSTDRGVTWSKDLRTITKATNGSVAVNNSGKIGYLCQRITGTGAGERWVTQFESSVDGINWDTKILADVSATSPTPRFQPYIGDYACLLSVDNDFYGIFSANNRPDPVNFPNGVKYQRKHDFNTRQLLDLTGNPVAVSIDPFFFKISG